MDCDTTGIEPDFALVKFKKLAGGGYFKIVNQSRPAGPREPRLHARGRSTTSSRYCHGRRSRSHGCPHVNPTSLQGQGLHRRGARRRSRRTLPGAFELPFAFNPWTLGDDVLQARSASPKASCDGPGVQPAHAPRLHARSRSTRPTTSSAARMTIEGAPHLKAEHLPVFDCANKCGKNGKRFIAAEATSA